MSNLLDTIDKWIDANKEECIQFLQELISIPSPSYHEKDAAKFLVQKMQKFGYNFTWIDQKNNALGIIQSKKKGRSLLLNGHIDHVPAGGMADPFYGKIMEGTDFSVDGEVIYGRAASDMKGAVAAMVLAGRLLNELNIKLLGDYKVAAVAEEEVGGAGTISSILDEQFLADIVLIGEATNMELALGHRGSINTSVVVKGRSCHASAPERGVNAVYKAIKMINMIREDLVPRLPDHSIYGKTSLVVTHIEVSPKVLNVVPEECIFYIDCRNNPNFTVEQLYYELKSMINKIREKDPDFEAFVLPSSLINGRKFSGFYTDPGKHQVVHEIIEIISEIYKKPKLGVWTFATDGRMYSRLGIPVIGFGPGEEKFAHTQQDHVKVKDYLDTIKVYAWIACKICGIDNNSASI